VLVWDDGGESWRSRRVHRKTDADGLLIYLDYTVTVVLEAFKVAVRIGQEYLNSRVSIPSLFHGRVHSVD
jgi:hypothetical protein